MAMTFGSTVDFAPRGALSPVDDADSRSWSSHVQLREWDGAQWTEFYSIALGDMRAWPAVRRREFISTLDAQLRLCRHGASSGYRHTVSIPTFDKNGFDIDLYLDAGVIHAAFGGLNQEFASIGATLVWVERAMSRAYRLCTIMIGGRPREWRLEPVSGASGPDETLVSGVPVFLGALRKKTSTYQQNTFLA